MAGHGSDSWVRLYALVNAPRTFLHSARTLFLATTFAWSLGTNMLVAAPLGAQGIIGTLVEAETGAPVEGAAVILLNRSGDQVDWSLTDAAGRFNFRMSQAGTYLLRADRIGHVSVLSDPIPVDRGVTAVYRLETPVEAILLAGIDVRSSRRCEIRPGEGVSTARVWEEARKALEATSRTNDLRAYRYVIRHFERELDARGRRVTSEESRIQRGVMASPFASLNVEVLLERGFVQSDGDGFIYYAPDADVLLSDAFLDTHCMNLTYGDDEAEGLLGLSFEPTEDRRVTDISGVLWLDPEDGELQWLDYRYEFLDIPDSDRLGGKIRFYGLPNGTWIVREWYIRTPVLGESRRIRRRGRIELVGLREQGGLVVSVNDLQGELVLDVEAGIIEGVVLGSGGSDPVEEVVVFMDDGRRVTTDENGRFRFTALPEGYYGLRVFNPVLDSLGLSGEPVFYEVSPGEVTSARLRFPSSDTVMAEQCAPADLAAEPSAHEGILTGFALDERGDPLPGSRVSVAWEEFERRANGTLSTVYKTLTTSELPDNGFFLMCGVPTDLPVDITIEWNGIESELEEFRFPVRQRISRRDITFRRGR